MNESIKTFGIVFVAVFIGLVVGPTIADAAAAESDLVRGLFTGGLSAIVAGIFYGLGRARKMFVEASS